MTKGKKYQTEQTQEARRVIYVNTEINNSLRPESKKVNNSYENLQFSHPKNTAESPKPISSDSQLAVPVAITRSIRCLQVTSVALLFAFIIMAATLGSMMSDLKARKEGTEGKSDLLIAEKEKKGNDLQQLKSQITQMTSGLNDLATLFQHMNDTIKSQSRSITQLKAERNSVFQTLKDHNTRITDIEGLPMIGFTAKGWKNHTNGVLIYKSILSQVGGGFNTSTGVFTCPIAGLYLISMTLHVHTIGEINCSLYKNRYKIGPKIHIDGIYEESASQTVVLRLHQGDRLYIGSCADDNIGDETTLAVALIEAVP